MPIVHPIKSVLIDKGEKKTKTINDFYKECQQKKNSIRKIQYGGGVYNNISDFFRDFIQPRLPDPSIVLRWNALLRRYLFQENNHIFFIRKYESNKDRNHHWDNRRGAVVRFKDGTEIVYSSNFLAHEIYLMA